MLRQMAGVESATTEELVSLSDAELVERVRAGRLAAFEPILRRYNRRLFRAARGITGTDAEAEDALQDAYIRAYRHLDQFRGPNGLGAWLTRIVVNEALMRRRRPDPGAAETMLLDDDTFQDTTMHDGRNAPPTPEEATSNEQLGGLLERSIDRLPAAYRTTFVLRDVEGLSVAETAESLGIAQATVKTRLHRARRQLRRTLSRELRSAIGEAYPFAGHRCDRIVANVLHRLSAAPGPTPGSEYH